MKTISEYITILNNTKNNMISKLNSHGLNVSQSDSIYSLSNKIGDIESGVRLNLFSQTSQPTTYDGIWINTSSTVNKLTQVEDFLAQWNTKFASPLPYALCDFGCDEYDGKIYCIGGTNSSVLNTNYIYDIANNIWSIGSNMPISKAGEATAYDGKIYCIGGYTNGLVTNSTNYIYDIDGDSWSIGTNMPISKRSFGCDSNDGKIYCIGGYTTATSNTNYIYDIAGDTWSTGTAMTGSKHGFNISTYDGKLYCIGGWNTSVINTNSIYDIAQNSWSTGMAMIGSKSTFGSTLYNAKIYCIGGYIGSSNVNTNYIYDIINNSWSNGPVLPILNRAFRCIIYGNRIYCIGGYTTATSVMNYVYSPDGPINIAIYNSDTLILQNTNSMQPYSTILTSSNTFIGSYKIQFTDVAINSINADIYYGDGTQWIKIKSAT